MGTRADFYVGIGENAEWIGSTSYDGDPRGWGTHPLRARTEAEFRAAVEQMLSDDRAVVTRPSEGWPWPWEDSHTTDWAYAWDPERGLAAMSKGKRWTTLAEYEADSDHPHHGSDRGVVFPDMSKRMADSNTILAKSGLMFLRGR